MKPYKITGLFLIAALPVIFVLYGDPLIGKSENQCFECHTSAKNSSPLPGRSGTGRGIKNKIDTAYKNHCGGCHSSCGQCHLSRPDSVGGGLLEGHLFQKIPPMKPVRAACHGSRIGREFFGENKGMKPDVHHQKYMKCGKCPTGEEMHEDGKEYPHRYAVEPAAFFYYFFYISKFQIK